MSQIINEKKITCDSCGYTWHTKSEMVYVTCPSCMHKVNTEKKRR